MTRIELSLGLYSFTFSLLVYSKPPKPQKKLGANVTISRKIFKTVEQWNAYLAKLAFMVSRGYGPIARILTPMTEKQIKDKIKNSPEFRAKLNAAFEEEGQPGTVTAETNPQWFIAMMIKWDNKTYYLLRKMRDEIFVNKELAGNKIVIFICCLVLCVVAVLCYLYI